MIDERKQVTTAQRSGEAREAREAREGPSLSPVDQKESAAYSDWETLFPVIEFPRCFQVPVATFYKTCRVFLTAAAVAVMVFVIVVVVVAVAVVVDVAVSFSSCFCSRCCSCSWC